MLTENDAVGAETIEEVTAAAALDSAAEGTAAAPVVDAAESPLLLAAVSETGSVPEMNDAPEPEVEAEASGDEVDAAGGVGAQDVVEETQLAAQPEPKVAKRQKKRRPDPVVAQVVSWFAACGRCSFFLAGYRAVVGEEALATAVSQQYVGQQQVGQQQVGQRDNQWLMLNWSQAVANLVHKSYGSRVDIDHYHYEGRCQDCRRVFVYHEAETETTFRIKLKS